MVSSMLYLIEILHQTTTSLPLIASGLVLYLIEILHQTTTSCRTSATSDWLYLIEILHQTTTYGRQRVPQKCCILSKFYIKPQRTILLVRIFLCCILSKFYIKPQQLDEVLVGNVVVSYRNSTSNHNVGPHID